MIIDGNKITADEGKLLLRKADNLLFGKELVLGYTHYINGERIDPPHLEVPEDYCDSDYIEVDGSSYPVTSFEYSYLVDKIVKIKYSPEDQIAIMCNRDLYPGFQPYEDSYWDMQEWRKKAKEIAKQYSK